MGYNRIETSKFLNLLILEAFFSITFITRAVFYLKNIYSRHIAVLPFGKYVQSTFNGSNTFGIMKIFSTKA